MTPTHDSPDEVVLEKTSEDTWQAQAIPKRRLKSWQRLWIVSGVIYLLILAGSYHLLMPDKEGIERRMIWSVTEEVRRYDGLAFAGESPKKIFEIARSQGYATWIAQVRRTYRIGAEGNAGFDRIDAHYREAVSSLPLKRIVGNLICVVAWAVPMAVLYTIGAVVDWVKRGARIIRD
jgi:hypothetical protein